MPGFNQQGFNQQQFGSTHVTAALAANGTCSTAIQVVRRRIASGLVCTGGSTAALWVRRIRRTAATIAGTSATSIQPHRWKPIPLFSSGQSAASQSGVVRRRSYLQIISTGRSQASIGVSRVVRRGPLSVGTSHTAMRLVKIALPPPITNALRVARWTRPVFNANLRFTGWTAPA